MTTSPDIKYLTRHPAHFVALGFGAGLAPKAPGTIGTLVALPLFGLMMQIPGQHHVLILELLFLIGMFACHKTGIALGVPDHGSIVWDEIVAMMILLEFTLPHWTWWLVAFGLFRLFDIWKPFPIRQCDARMKNGFGVMFDDLLAAVYALLTMKVIIWIMLHL